MIPGTSFNLISGHPPIPDVFDDGRFRLMLGGSLILHFLVLGLVFNLRLTATVERPMASYQVSLISSSDLAVPPSAQKVEARKPVEPDVPAPPHAKNLAGETKESAPPSVAMKTPPPHPEPPKENPEPAFVEIPAPPPLSESLAGELTNIVVPAPQKPVPVQEKSEEHVPTVSRPAQSSTTKKTASIIPPPAIPKMEAVPSKPVEKAPQPASPKSPTMQAAIQETVKSVVVPRTRVMRGQTTPVAPKTQEKRTPSPKKPALPLVPKAPTLAKVAPLPKQKTRGKISSQVTEAVSKSIQSVKVPKPSTSRAHVPPPPAVQKHSKPMPDPAQKSPSVTQHKTEELTASLRETLKGIEVPKPRSRKAFQPPPAAIKPIQPPSPPITKEIAPLLTDAVKNIKIPKPKLISPPSKSQVTSSPVKPAAIKKPEKLKPILPPITLPSEPPRLEKIPEKQRLPVPRTKESVQIHAALEQSKKQINDLKIPSVTQPSPPMKPMSSQVSGDGAVSEPPSLQMVGGMADGHPYWGRVRDKIDQKWVAPPVEETQRQGPLKVIVAFRIDRDGNISRVRIQQPSGNAYYDIAAQRAVVDANPLPHFPPDMPDRYYDIKFQFSVVKKEG